MCRHSFVFSSDTCQFATVGEFRSIFFFLKVESCCKFAGNGRERIQTLLSALFFVSNVASVQTASQSWILMAEKVVLTVFLKVKQLRFLFSHIFNVYLPQMP